MRLVGCRNWPKIQAATGSPVPMGASPMFSRTGANPTSPPSILGRLNSAQARIIASEFNYRKGTEIYGEKEPAEYIYQITAGAVRSYKLLSDGRRQIGAFHLVEDVFGLENGSFHRFTAEAIVDTSVRLIRRGSLE